MYEPAARARWAYSVECTWWDIIEMAGDSKVHSPVCPFCGAQAYFAPDAQTLMAKLSDVEQYAYRWGQGKCYPEFGVLIMAAYRDMNPDR